MQLASPILTTTSTRKRKNKKTKKQLTADAEHEKWLKKMGAHPSQRKKRVRSHVVQKPTGGSETQYPPLSNKIVPIVPSGALDEETKLKYSSQYVVGQVYNKGGIQVLSQQEAKDPATGKRRV